LLAEPFTRESMEEAFDRLAEFTEVNGAAWGERRDTRAAYALRALCESTDLTPDSRDEFYERIEEHFPPAEEMFRNPEEVLQSVGMVAAIASLTARKLEDEARARNAEAEQHSDA
jgi:hypothetical protein